MICSIMDRDSFIISKGCHTENVLMAIIDGCFELTIDGKTVTAGKNSVIYFQKHKNFTRKVLEPLKIIYIVFDYDPTIPSGVLHFKNIARKDGTLELLKNAIISNNLHFARHFCNDLLTQLKAENQNFSVSLSKEISAFLEYVEENHKNKIIVEEYAKNIFMSHTGFLLKFKREMGITPIEYINNYRMEKAVILLSFKGLSIGEVAEECGYDNLYYFSNAFKKNFGISPKAFKNNTL